MDDQNHIELLRLQSTELTGSTPFCPEDQEIAEYFDGDLAKAERTRMERHLTDCRFCLARIGILERLEENRTNKRIPGAVLATAKQMRKKAPPRWPRKAGGWATAAVVMITIFTIANRNQEPTVEPGATPPVVPSAEANSRQLRSVARVVTDLNVLTPTPGADILPGSLIQWAEVPGNLHYNIFVLSHAGDVLWTERLADTEWALLESIQLTEGDKYYFRVEANLQNGRTVSSKHLAFRFVERQ